MAPTLTHTRQQDQYRWDPVINDRFSIIFIYQVLIILKEVMQMTHLHKQAHRLFMSHWHWNSTLCQIYMLPTSNLSRFSVEKSAFLGGQIIQL